jgi:hypothetical protein
MHIEAVFIYFPNVDIFVNTSLRNHSYHGKDINEPFLTVNLIQVYDIASNITRAHVPSLKLTSWRENYSVAVK